MYHKVNMAQNKHILIGQVGEEIAAGYLQNRGFRVIERNFRKKWGELDIVAEKNSVLHFIEVKAGSFYTHVPKEGKEAYRPEDHMHVHKKSRMKRIVQTYVHEKKISMQKEWTIDLVVVHINTETKQARVRILENILLD
jgi:putative endonuclease